MSRAEALLWVLLMSRTPAEAATYTGIVAEQSRNEEQGSEARKGSEYNVVVR